MRISDLSSDVCSSDLDPNTLTIGTVGPVSGLKTNGGTVDIQTAGDLTLESEVTGSTEVTFTSGAGIIQTGGRIETDRLVVSSVDDLALDQDDNRVGALVASVSGPGKSLSFTGETGFVADGARTVDGGITLASPNGALP